MTITKQRIRETPWFSHLQSTAIAALFASLIRMTSVHDEEVRLKDAELKTCQEERTKAEREFREECQRMNAEVTAFREEIYRQALRSEKELRKLKKR